MAEADTNNDNDDNDTGHTTWQNASCTIIIITHSHRNYITIDISVILKSSPTTLSNALWRGIKCLSVSCEFNIIATIKVTISRKSSYLHKVLKFKKTSPFSWNYSIKSRFLNGSTAPLIGHYFSFKNTSQWKDKKVICYSVCFLSRVKNKNVY